MQSKFVKSRICKSLIHWKLTTVVTRVKYLHGYSLEFQGGFKDIEFHGDILHGKLDSE